MWSANISITNNTNYNVNYLNSFNPNQFISPYSGTYSWTTSETPNTSSMSFFVPDGVVEFQAGLHFGENCGVWADRGFMESPSVIMDVVANGVSYSQELNGGTTILEDFSMGGNISITFRNKVSIQEFKLG